ncbi:glycosyltransferase family 2 protein [Pseudorhodobacter ferrugineus]|uniref:glycosyltransferase family 2 protein n=1 Tax=Pseudorhodobacter ferrugineus TaxID=77008 RepID=UPI0003B2E931|nr:glycosyltransferase [Pseudorhodobacter ferrugineus]
MTPLSASLIIVSRHRPAALMRALAGVAQMDHPSFEVIVVADPAAAQAVRAAKLQVKLAEYDSANISAARNIGLQLAAAPIAAFLDDDAVPEPTWLSRLTAPFADIRVTAAGGYVLGRSGLSWQWRAMWVDGDGIDHPFTPPEGISLHAGTATRAIKTQGTNCAFRRDDLLAIGGFDAGFAFYLDEADVNLRLAARGGLTAIVPDAVVHHGFAASDRRRADRVPTDLTQIGRSLARFTALHGQSPDAIAKHVTDQRARLLRHMISGALEPRDIGRLMAGLQDGIAAANTQAYSQTPLAPTTAAFLALPDTAPRTGRVLFGTKAQCHALYSNATAARARGEIVTAILLSRGMRPHTHRFTEHGWWEQTGGRFGPAFRLGQRFVWQTAAKRRNIETTRLANYRPVGPILPPKTD